MTGVGVIRDLVGRVTVRRPRLRNVSLASRLSLLVLAVTVTALVVTSTVSLVSGARLADGLLGNRLESLLAINAERVARHLNTLEMATQSMARSPATAEAMAELSVAFADLESRPSQASDALIEFYREDYAPALRDALGGGASWSRLLPKASAAVYLQEEYVQGTPASERDLVDDAGDGSSWSAVHAEVHPWLRDVRDRLQVEDLYLVDLGGNVVYSSAKKPDFGTSLDTGPYGGTTLAAVVRRVTTDPAEGVQLSDLAPYIGNAGRPEAFIAAPIMDQGALVGVFVVAFEADGLTAIMTGNGDWEAHGMGETGESFLIGVDGTLRSESRLLMEDPAQYPTVVEQAGTADAATVAAVEATGTAVSFQRVVDPIAIAATDSRPVIATGYLGTEVYAAYAPLGYRDLGWYVGTQMGRSEVEGPVVEFRRALLIAVAVFVVAITFATVAWSRRVFAPVRNVSERLRRARTDVDLGPPINTGSTLSEFESLAAAIEDMLRESTIRHRRIASASAERISTMRSLLPSGVADRVRSGERQILDYIDQASIVVLTLRGIGPMLDAGGVDEGRSRIAALVDRLDALAGEHGLEPVKLVGDSYFAACGLGRPFLDHGPRAVGFARAAVLALGEVDTPEDLQLSVGVASGPVTVGLTGSSRFVYDLWGPTVAAAAAIARAAGPGEILIPETVAAMLPSDMDVTPVPDGRVADEAVFSVAVDDISGVRRD